MVVPKEILSIKISTSWKPGLTPQALYDATRRSWKLNRSRIASIDTVLCIAENEVKEVYSVEEWVESQDEGRVEFIGHVAPASVRQHWMDTDVSGLLNKYGHLKYIPLD